MIKKKNRFQKNQIVKTKLTENRKKTGFRTSQIPGSIFASIKNGKKDIQPIKMANFISFAQSYKGKKIINKKLLDVLHLVYVKINYH